MNVKQIQRKTGSSSKFIQHCLKLITCDILLSCVCIYDCYFAYSALDCNPVRLSLWQCRGASLNDPPPELQQLALNFLETSFSRRRVVVTFALNFLATFSDDLFLVLALTYRTTTVITSARSQKMFTLRNMRPLSIGETVTDRRTNWVHVQ